MKIAVIVAIAVIVLGGYAGWLLAFEGRAAAETAATAARQPVFACDRLAISPEHRKRHEELNRILGSSTLSVREVGDGFEFELGGDPATYHAVMEWIPDERACCPFFEITLRLEQEQGKIWLGFSGRQGVKPFIKAEFAPWFRP